jgi:mannan endo-1,4-beta-mannosidase
MLRFRLLLFVLFLGSPRFVAGQSYLPSDTLATTETRWLYSSMQRLKGTGVMFGHHDDTAYGVKWKLKDSSDIKNVTGSYPAVYGWDLSGIELDSPFDINRINFTDQARLVREVYERGGVNTFCWHMNNPVNKKTAWDTSGTTLKQMLPGGSYHNVYVSYLEKAAKYLSTLKGRNGEPIPILFRPFHELTGDWFWWGTQSSTPDEFAALWRFTINYLRNTKNLHNLLVVYSTANYYSEVEMMERYPEDDMVDFLGFDLYCFDSVKVYKDGMKRQLDLLQQVATDHHKMACIGETGYQGIPNANWWTQTLAPVLAQYNQLSYVLIWRNHGLEHFYAPYPGQISADDFKSFYHNSNVIFQDKLTPAGIYGPKHMLRYNRNTVLE